MISIARLPEPAKLAENKEKWLAVYLEKHKTNASLRPASRQYGHPEIRNTLEAMSFSKCFYCERKLSEVKGEVEHYIEVAEDPTLAFAWNNLYLSCPECNRHKLPNLTIPVHDCINPCEKTVNPAKHLTFDDEYIKPNSGSTKGLKTIQKYRLDRRELNYLWVRQIKQFERFFRKLRERQLRDGGRALTDSEKKAVASFKQPDHAFSLMFSIYLADLEL